MPFGGEGKGIFYGAGRVIPLGDLMMVNDGMFVPQVGTPGGPVALIFQAAMNFDMFKQLPIRQEGMTQQDKFAATTEFLLRGSAPAIGTRAYDFIDKAYFGKTGPLGSQANTWVEAARLLGLNFREVDFGEAAYNKSVADTNKIRSIKTFARKAVNQELRYALPDFGEIQDRYDTMNQMINDIYGGI